MLSETYRQMIQGLQVRFSMRDVLKAAQEAVEVSDSPIGRLAATYVQSGALRRGGGLTRRLLALALALGLGGTSVPARSVAAAPAARPLAGVRTWVVYYGDAPEAASIMQASVTSVKPWVARLAVFQPCARR